MNTTHVFDADGARRRALEAIVLNITDAPDESAGASLVSQVDERAPVVRALNEDVAGWPAKAGRRIASLWGGPRRALPEPLASSRDRMIHASRL